MRNQKVIVQIILIFCVFNAVGIAKEVEKSEIYKFGLLVGECFKAHYDEASFALTREEAKNKIYDCVNIVALGIYLKEYDIFMKGFIETSKLKNLKFTKPK